MLDNERNNDDASCLSNNNLYETIYIIHIIIIIIIKYEKITVTLSQPNVAGALYKVNEDMPMSVDA